VACSKYSSKRDSCASDIQMTFLNLLTYLEMTFLNLWPLFTCLALYNQITIFWQILSVMLGVKAQASSIPMPISKIIIGPASRGQSSCKKVTLDVYPHVLPHMQHEAMSKLNDLLADRE
jgi:hypothetical protein